MSNPVNPSLASATLLGVDLLWPNPGPGWLEPIHAGRTKLHELIRGHTADPMRRQKRDLIMYWDAMTAVRMAHFLPERLQQTELGLLAIDLTLSIGHQQLSDKLMVELGSFEPLARAHSQIDSFSPEKLRREEHFLSRQDLVRTVYDANGKPRLQRPGVYRRLQLEMPDLKGNPDSIDWYEALLLALLLQLRCDIEIYVETGFLRVHVCERFACHAFFRVKRMAGRQRFCSATCRASAAREQ